MFKLRLNDGIPKKCSFNSMYRKIGQLNKSRTYCFVCAVQWTRLIHMHKLQDNILMN